MSVSRGQRWSGWQFRSEERTRHPRIGDLIQTRVEGSPAEGVVVGVGEEVEGRYSIVAEINLSIPGSTIRRRLVEALDDQLTEGVWAFRPEPQPEEHPDGQAAPEPADETRAATASRPCLAPAAQASRAG